jgi:glycosyltransferase involved in cell wall biosynthesis
LKVLIVNTLFYPDQLGGAEFSVLNLAVGMQKMGHEVLVLATSKEDQAYQWQGIQVRKCYIPNVFWRYEASQQSVLKKVLWRIFDFYNPFTWLKVSKIIKEFDPDIVHTNNIAGFSVSIFDVIKWYKKPIVHTTRDFYLICAKSSMFKAGKSCNNQCISCACFSWSKKLKIQKVDQVVYISAFMKDIHKKLGYFEGKPNQVIFNSIGSPAKITDSLIEDSSIKFGFLGSIRPEKGIEKLVEVFANHLNHELIVAGEGYKEGYLEDLKIRSTSNIKFVGFQHKEDFFNSIDLLIHPAMWQEPFGRVVIESYSYGKPVIVTKMGGLKEIVKDNVTGFLMDTTNFTSELNEMLMRLSKEQLIQMKEDCLEYSKAFIDQEISNQYFKVFKNNLK